MVPLVFHNLNRLPTGSFSPISLIADSFRIKWVESAAVPVKPFSFHQFHFKERKEVLVD